MRRVKMNLVGEIAPIEIHIRDTHDLYQSLLRFATEGDILLAHAIDGVIWGIVLEGELHTSHHIDTKISPELRIETLLQLRLFNSEREIYLWGDNNSWQARYASEYVHDEVEGVIQEYHVLWGTKGTSKQNGFTLLEDGSQGLRHLIPIDACRVNEKSCRACLKVYHHLHRDAQTGLNSITYSRLAGIEVVNYE